MPFKVGVNAVIRTKSYLEAGKIYLNDKIKIFCIHVNGGKPDERHKGLTDFIEWHLPQIQYKNPEVHCIVLKNMTPSPFIRCFLDNGNDILIDVDNKDKKEILNHVTNVLGKSKKQIQQELLAKEKKENPANFGYLCNNHCMCQILGQVPCPSVIPLPNVYRDKWRREHKDELN